MLHNITITPPRLTIDAPILLGLHHHLWSTYHVPHLAVTIVWQFYARALQFYWLYDWSVLYSAFYTNQDLSIFWVVTIVILPMLLHYATSSMFFPIHKDRFQIHEWSCHYQVIPHQEVIHTPLCTSCDNWGILLWQYQQCKQATMYATSIWYYTYMVRCHALFTMNNCNSCDSIVCKVYFIAENPERIKGQAPLSIAHICSQFIGTQKPIKVFYWMLLLLQKRLFYYLNWWQALSFVWLRDTIWKFLRAGNCDLSCTTLLVALSNLFLLN